MAQGAWIGFIMNLSKEVSFEGQRATFIDYVQ